MKDGKRCKEGYHLLDTVSDTGVTNPVLDPTPVTVGSGANNESIKDFLSVMIK